MIILYAHTVELIIQEVIARLVLFSQCNCHFVLLLETLLLCY